VRRSTMVWLAVFVAAATAYLLLQPSSADGSTADNRTAGEPVTVVEPGGPVAPTGR